MGEAGSSPALPAPSAVLVAEREVVTHDQAFDALGVDFVVTTSLVRVAGAGSCRVTRIFHEGNQIVAGSASDSVQGYDGGHLYLQ